MLIGYQTFKAAVKLVSEGLMLQIAVPDSIMPWFERTARIKEAFGELGVCHKQS